MNKYQAYIQIRRYHEGSASLIDVKDIPVNIDPEEGCTSDVSIGKIRDFYSAHPDSEIHIPGPDVGQEAQRTPPP